MTPTEMQGQLAAIVGETSPAEVLETLSAVLKEERCPFYSCLYCQARGEAVQLALDHLERYEALHCGADKD